MPDNESGARLARLSEDRYRRSLSSVGPISTPRPYYGGGITSSRFKIGAGILLVIFGAAGFFAAAGNSMLAAIPALVGLFLIVFKLTAKHTHSYSIERFAIHCTVLVGLLGVLSACAGIVYSAVLLFRVGGWQPAVLLAGAALTLLVCGISCFRFISDEY